MSNSATQRPTTRAARAAKSAEARRQREEKAAKLAASKSEETPTPDPAPETPETDAQTPETETSETSSDPQVGAIMDSVPAKGTGERPSIWSTRIEDAVNQLVDAEKADGVAGAVMFVAKTPKTATTTANKVRTKIAEGLVVPLGFTGENIIARGKVIFVTYKTPVD